MMKLLYKVSRLQACNTKVAGKTIIRSVNEFSWVATKVFTRMVIEKYVSRFQPLSIPSLVPLTFTWREHDTGFFLNELTWSIFMMETFVILE